MHRTFVISLLLLLVLSNAYAQHKINFEINTTAGKEKNSLYNKIRLIDSRSDTTNLGFVQTGALNRNTKVVSKRPLSAEVTSILNSLTDTNAGNAELLLQLRKLSFAEKITGITETGYFAIQAEMYAKTGQKYQRIATIDTLFRLTSGVDVTNKLLRTGSDTLTGFIHDNLTAQSKEATLYSYNDLVHIDSIEKRAIKVYNTTTYTDGIYMTYNSFKNQLPDKQITVTGAYVYPGNVKAIDEKGKLKNIKKNNTYAMVYKGQPYIINHYGFYALNKVTDEFLFTGKADVAVYMGNRIAASALFGLVGGLITSADSDATFEMKIDHRNGMIIRLKEIKDTVVKPAVSKGDSWD